MQKIYLEKNVNLRGKCKDIVSISVDDSIDYKIESNGIRAVGQILISGDYNTYTDRENFEEVLDLDILAPFEKIVDRRDFNIKIEDFNYEVQKGDINIEIQAVVHGVLVSEDRHITDIEDRVASEEINIEEDIEEIRKIMETIDESELNFNDEISEDTVENYFLDRNDLDIDFDDLAVDEVDGIMSDTGEDVLISGLEDLYEGIESKYVSYRLYVVQQGDTYSSIASRYRIDIDSLIQFNQDKILEKNSLVVIPSSE